MGGRARRRRDRPSPITGELIAQFIVEGRTEIPLDPFRLDRFANSPDPAGEISSRRCRCALKDPQV